MPVSVSFDEQRRCGTRCQSIYGSATVSDSLNGC